MKYVNTLIFSNQPFIRFLRHIIFWVTDIINWLLVASIGGVPKGEIQSFLLCFPFAVVTTYYIIYFIIPKFSTHQDKARLFLLIIGILLSFGIFLRIYKVYLIYPLVGMEFDKSFDAGSVGRLIREIFSWLGVMSMAIIIKLVKNRTELEEKNDQLLSEKRSAELNFLKAQMHPHFLFNTLNTLYSETIQNSDKAQQIVLNLASLLRFILDECNKPVINLGKEIKVIQNYIELEKLRHGSRLQVTLSVPDQNFDPPISPLIFLPFVENSFKHSLNNVRGVVTIDVRITVSSDDILLSVENDHIPGVVQSNNTGKGIGNVKRQLELLYDKNYKLNIIDSERKYQVSLSIPLKFF
ncbi:MAG: histidine kinase [Chryseolinea sp.]